MQPDNPSTQPPPAPPPLSRPDLRRIDPREDMLEVGERLITTVHRHPIGIIAIYLEALAGVVAIAALALVVMPDGLNGLSTQEVSLLTGGIILALAMLIFFLFVATYVYRQSRMLITDRGLVQMTQSSLFVRKVTRLSFSNVEDVSAERRGILPMILNYGTMMVQTAGTMDNFVFKYCPNPSYYADTIIEAREQYAQSLKEENER